MLKNVLNIEIEGERRSNGGGGKQQDIGDACRFIED